MRTLQRHNLEYHIIGPGIEMLPISAWQDVLHDVLNAIRSLLCTTTNATPHERMFNFERRSSTGTALPVWLCEPGEVLLKRFDGRSKYDPIVEVVEHSRERLAFNTSCRTSCQALMGNCFDSRANNMVF